MSPDKRGERPAAITELLERTRSGDIAAREDLFRSVFDELRAIASASIRRIGRSSDMGATSVVQDAVLRLLERRGLAADSRDHFFFLMRRAIGDVLVERLRSSDAEKRGGGAITVSIDDGIAETTPGAPEAVDADALVVALDALAETDAHAAAAFLLIQCYGSTIDGAAKAMDRTYAQARDDHDYARAWLRRRLGDGDGRPR
jgi:RNA polymerase sigma factor (TIGR02999 family)